MMTEIAELNQEHTPLTLDVLLSNSCANPVEWGPYEEHQAAVSKWLNTEPEERSDDMPIYRGWLRMDITLHCSTWEIIARRLEDGSYEVKEYHLQDH